MGFPGTWMTESESMVYRVVPKCACSTIGQIMYYSDHGRFFDGDIHDATDGLHKWSREESQGPISANVRTHSAFTFTCVRNPYSRILSSFFDKICGTQRNGRRYRGNLVPMLVQKYGVEVEGEFDQIRSFRRFLLFARDTIRWRRPMEPDIHWSAMSGHISTFIVNGGRYDHIFFTEKFNEGMQVVLD
ncbi:MAG: sulfotransferase family protein, partial [Rhodobacteraceae bacterium]|nr:sulfotransferase family protein [Paracoccaceae bacterium]